MRSLLTLLTTTLVLAAPATLRAGEGPGCTAPAETCLEHLSKTLADRGWVGVELERHENGEMTILTVAPDSPAASAGLRVGDRLVSLNGVRFAGAESSALQAAQAKMTAGATVTYGIVRDGRPQSADVVLGKMPERIRYQIVGQHMMQHVPEAKMTASAQGYEGQGSGQGGGKAQGHGGEGSGHGGKMARGHGHGHGHGHAHGKLSEVSLEDVAGMVRSNDAVILDANNPMTRERFGVIPRAKLLSSSGEYDVASELPADKTKTLVFYCANERCTASDRAAERAMAAGYTDVHVFRAGIKGWADAGKPTKRVRQSDRG